MSNDFQINTAIQMNGFNNSIKDFNKTFGKINSNSVNNLPDETNFNEIFNSIAKNPLKGTAQFNLTDNIELKEKSEKNISPLLKTAQDIGNGLRNSLIELNTINKQAETDFETFASGGDISVHDVMISAQKSNLAMSMAIQLRNQAINAYNELKNMSI